jgi:hypothetical protein
MSLQEIKEVTISVIDRPTVVGLSGIVASLSMEDISFIASTVLSIVSLVYVSINIYYKIQEKISKQKNLKRRKTDKI